MENNDKYIGQFLDNRYEILEKIGSGGMAVVYKARCHRLNRLVAIKILKDELAGDADFRRRFRTESQAVAMLSHTNIVAVFDVSRSGNIEYIVMELIEGITLKQYINRKGLLNWKESLHFATQVAKALSHAHSRGIIHRDIKPHNIMILKDGSVKVADFGIARLQSTQNTLTQEALGSVHYISPEQAKGSHVDARSDIYSLGVVMYEMLTSHLPFEGDSAVSVAIQHISAIPLMPREINPDIPFGLESITMHAMEADLNRRYASIEELLQDLEEFRKNPAIQFSYFGADSSINRFSADQATREMPSGAIIKAESALPKPVRTPNRTADLTREEYRRSSKRSSKTSTMIGVVGIIVFLLVVFLFMYKFVLQDWFNPPEVTVTIPKFVGVTYTEVSSNADYKLLYNFTVTEEYNETYDADVITAQNPQPDRQMQANGTLIEIELTVSKGKEPNEVMPEITNMDYREAVIKLQGIDPTLKIEKSHEYNDSITKDYVISTVPSAGDELIKGGIVYITYSDGPEIKTTIIQDVEGMNIEAAKNRLEGYNLTWDVTYINSPTVPIDEVISQDLVPGSEVAVDTEVILVVSLGPVEIPSPSPSPTPDPTPTDEFPTTSPPV